MQHLTYLRNGTSRLSRVADICYLHVNKSVFFNTNPLVLSQRCASNTNKSSNDTDANRELYKPSTTKQKTHILDELKGREPTGTIDSTSASSGKVWSVRSADEIRTTPLDTISKTFVPTPTEGDKVIHETTVHTTYGKLNINNPLKTASNEETIFAPKISSTDLYSSPSSPTSQYGNTIKTKIEDVPIYESSTQSKVFGGQDTSVSTKAHSTEDPFNNKKTTNRSSDINEVPIQRQSDLRDEILRESLKYVDDNGWTIEAIRAGIRASNQPTTLEGLFSNGYDLVEFFQHDANVKMADYMKEQKKKGDIQGSRLLIEGLKYRLSLVIPYSNTWGQALAQGALPQNAMRSWKNLFELSSEAWYGIGDVSTDINWYSKRLLLAAIYKSAEIFMLQDQSQDKFDTMSFLERRLNDFQTMGSLQNTVSNSLSDTAQIANGLFSVIRNLTSRR